MFVFGAIAYALGATAVHAQLANVAFVCDTDKHHVVIDHAADVTLSYQAWNKPHTVNQKPDIELHAGTEETIGTDPCVSTNWTFKRGNVEYWVSDSATCTDGKPPRGAYGNIVVEINKQFVSRYWCVK
ncbi:hypothetical protein [Paraburkholderia phenazinium]|uniref:Uncharacterized protein n=1 Tax=Paraburkholderia phenazinium TaxID=60549 RepID=A0A1G7PKR8_9BURK|nr:hypothetical protein [Paraburkholderia phenazinium]SDF86818.1 hypothetical protein SAMN05216466_101348 [Paraburkholderia phenazinium]